jgi:hypothetical protein
MRTSHPRKLRMAPPPYSKICNHAAKLTALLHAFPETARYVGWSKSICLRCHSPLYAVCLERDDTPLLVFCRTCFAYTFNESSPPFQRAMSRMAPREEIKPPHDDKPLERALNAFMATLKDD